MSMELVSVRVGNGSWGPSDQDVCLRDGEASMELKFRLNHDPNVTGIVRDREYGNGTMNSADGSSVLFFNVSYMDSIKVCDDGHGRLCGNIIAKCGESDFDIIGPAPRGCATWQEVVISYSCGVSSGINGRAAQKSGGLQMCDCDQCPKHRQNKTLQLEFKSRYGGPWVFAIPVTLVR